MNTNIPVMFDWTIPTSSDEVEQLKETIDELVKESLWTFQENMYS